MNTDYQDFHTMPVAIQAAALLNGVTTADPHYARTLVLGNKAWRKLLANAHAWPQSVTIGIDLDEMATMLAQQHAQNSSLSNIEFFSAGLGDLLTVDPGQFDYILIQDGYSLVGDTERSALLSWCQQHLSEQGIICVFNWCLPGAQPVRTLQQALSLHARRAQDEPGMIASARAMLSYLAMTSADDALKAHILDAESCDDLTLALRYLSDNDYVRYFSELETQFNNAGLVVVGDLFPPFECAENYGERVAEVHHAVAAQLTRGAAQQYLDFATARKCRYTLLTHSATPPECLPDFSKLEQLHWAGNFQRYRTEHNQLAQGHTTASGRLFATENVITLQIMDLLGGAWPMTLSFEQLVFNCRMPERGDDTRTKVLEALKELFHNNIDGLHWSLTPGPYNDATQNVLELIKGMSSSDFVQDTSIVVANYWGESVTLDKGHWQIASSGFIPADDQALSVFTELRAKGLLIGSAIAWKKALQRFLRGGRVEWLKSIIDTLFLLSVDQKKGGLLLSDVVVEPGLDAESDGMDEIYETVNALIKQNKFREARDYALALMEQSPNNIHILRCYSRTCVLTGSWDNALNSLCRLMGDYFSSLDIWFDLATALHKKGENFYAQKIIQGLLRQSEKNAAFWSMLGVFYHQKREMVLAEKCGRESIRFDGNNHYHLSIFGVALSDNQKLEEARYFLEKAVAIAPGHLDSYTSLLFVLTHDGHLPPDELFERHLEYGRRADKQVEKAGLDLVFNGKRDPERKLRIGFVSGDFRKHPVSNFFLPFWDAMDRGSFALYAYNTIDKEDEITSHFKDTADQWRDAFGLNDTELAQAIHQDNIDILFDLSGHTTGTRLPVFAFKPAPIQITWLGYPGTSGLQQMDYRIVSTGFVKTPEMEAQFTEKLIAIPLNNFFKPSPLSPPVNALPALSKGYITYGSFNRPKKLNDEVFALWADILDRNPDSKILIGFMDGDEMIARFRNKLNALGITNERLIFRKTTGLESYLKMHHDVDVLLDSFPYNGGTTSSHGIWMGVPTITLAGKTYASCQGQEILRIYGLDAFVASDKASYIDKALYWQTHLAELDAIRQSIRSKIQQTTDTNVVEPFQRALREAWRHWCAQEQPRSFTVTA